MRILPFLPYVFTRVVYKIRKIIHIFIWDVTKIYRMYQISKRLPKKEIFIFLKEYGFSYRGFLLSATYYGVGISAEVAAKYHSDVEKFILLLSPNYPCRSIKGGYGACQGSYAPWILNGATPEEFVKFSDPCLGTYSYLEFKKWNIDILDYEKWKKSDFSGRNGCWFVSQKTGLNWNDPRRRIDWKKEIWVPYMWGYSSIIKCLDQKEEIGDK